jgi:hypothetical protein
VVADDGELRVALEVTGEHLRVHPVTLRRGAFVFLILLFLGAAVEIRWRLVLIRFTMLSDRHVSRMACRYRQEGTYQGPPVEHFPHVAGRELVQLLVVAEDDNGYINVAEHGELIGLLEETAFPLQKGAIQGADS